LLEDLVDPEEAIAYLMRVGVPTCPNDLAFVDGSAARMWLADMINASGDKNMTTRVADLTVDDLRSLIQEVVTQTMEDLFRDPDEGLELREDFRSAVQQSLIATQAEGGTISAQDVATRLGLSW